MSQVRSEGSVFDIADTIEVELKSRRLRDVGKRLHTLGVHGRDVPALLGGIHMAGHDRRIAKLKARLALGDDDVTVERWLLLHAMQASAPRVAALPVPQAVKHFLHDEFAFMIRPDEASLRFFQYNRARFPAMAKLATLTRFPAGLFQWEESGLPRNWLARIPWRDLPRTVRMIARGLGGFRPLLVPHLNARRRSPWLTEMAANRSYYLMAGTIEAQPHLRGIMAASWFRAPGIVAVAPHLSWVNTVFLENGGLVTTVGPADEDSGVFANSPQRRALYDAGTFTPLIGLALWPREHVLAWKRAHPEFAPEATPVRRGERVSVPG